MSPAKNGLLIIYPRCWTILFPRHVPEEKARQNPHSVILKTVCCTSPQLAHRPFCVSAAGQSGCVSARHHKTQKQNEAPPDLSSSERSRCAGASSFVLLLLFFFSHVTHGTGVLSLSSCCGRQVELTPVAIAAGRRLSDRLFGSMKDAKLEYSCVPTVIFSHPPAGSVGLTEAEARAKYGDDDIKVFLLAVHCSTRNYKSRLGCLFVALQDRRDTPHTPLRIKPTACFRTLSRRGRDVSRSLLSGKALLLLLKKHNSHVLLPRSDTTLTAQRTSGRRAEATDSAH